MFQKLQGMLGKSNKPINPTSSSSNATNIRSTSANNIKGSEQFAGKDVSLNPREASPGTKDVRQRSLRERLASAFSSSKGSSPKEKTPSTREKVTAWLKREKPGYLDPSRKKPKESPDTLHGDL